MSTLTPEQVRALVSREEVKEIVRAVVQESFANYVATMNLMDNEFVHKLGAMVAVQLVASPQFGVDMAGRISPFVGAQLQAAVETSVKDCFRRAAQAIINNMY